MTTNEILLLLSGQHYRITHVQQLRAALFPALKPQNTSQKKKKIEIDIKMEI